MDSTTFHKGTWKAEAHAEQLSDGRFQGIVLLFNEQGSSSEQILHRAFDISDTPEGAMEEAKVLAQRVLHNID